MLPPVTTINASPSHLSKCFSSCLKVIDTHKYHLLFAFIGLSVHFLINQYHPNIGQFKISQWSISSSTLSLILCVPLFFKCFVKSQHYEFWMVIAILCTLVFAITADSESFFGLFHLPMGASLIGILPAGYLNYKYIQEILRTPENHQEPTIPEKEEFTEQDFKEIIQCYLRYGQEFDDKMATTKPQFWKYLVADFHHKYLNPNVALTPLPSFDHFKNLLGSATLEGLWEAGTTSEMQKRILILIFDQIQQTYKTVHLEAFLNDFQKIPRFSSKLEIITAAYRAIDHS